MQIFITGWWLCPELYLRRPFSVNGSSRVDALLEAKAKQGVQVLPTQLNSLSGLYLVPRIISYANILLVFGNLFMRELPFRWVFSSQGLKILANIPIGKCMVKIILFYVETKVRCLWVTVLSFLFILISM